MDKDRIAGGVEQAAGGVKEAVGRGLGDREMEAEGKVQQVEGQVRSDFGRLKDWLRRIFG
ncbi:MAG: CsbD family protein [Gemmatimonadales bacterium]